MAQTMNIPSSVEAALEAADLTAADLSSVVERAFAELQQFSVVPEADLHLLIDESGLDHADKASLRNELTSPTQAKGAALAELAGSVSRAVEQDALGLSAARAAQLAHVDSSTITRRVQRRELLAHRDGRGRLVIAKFQVTDSGILPGWDQVAPLLADVDPRTVRAFVSTPQDELDGSTVVAWLASGNDHEVVADLARGLTLW